MNVTDLAELLGLVVSVLVVPAAVLLVTVMVLHIFVLLLDIWEGGGRES